jgi:hypothetical protein
MGTKARGSGGDGPNLPDGFTPAPIRSSTLIGPRALSSSGKEIPVGVSRLPSGKLPSNYEYAGRLYTGEKWTDALAQKYPKGVSFTADGYPDFSPYAVRTVRFPNGFSGKNTDFTAADRMAGITGMRPSGHTWHHHQDRHTLLLIPTEIHDAVRHAGGVAIIGGVKR